MNEKQEIGKRLREEAIAKFGSLHNLSVAIKKSDQFMNIYYSGINAPGPKLRQQLSAVGIDIAYVLTGRKAGKAEPFNVKSIAPYMGRIYADPSGKEYFEEHHDGNIGVPMSPGNFFCLEIDNDSLINAEPIPIYPGDICIFELNRQPKNGDIVAIQFNNGKRTVKIFKHKSKDVAQLISANKYRNYPAIEIKKTDIKNYGIFVEKRQMTEQQKKRYGIK